MPALALKGAAAIIAAIYLVVSGLTNIFNINDLKINPMDAVDPKNPYYEILIDLNNGEEMKLIVDTEEQAEISVGYMAFIKKNGKVITEWDQFFEEDELDKTKFNNYSEWYDSLTPERQKQIDLVVDTILIPDNDVEFGELQKIIRNKTVHQKVQERWFNK